VVDRLRAGRVRTPRARIIGPRHGRAYPDAGEIGYTWFARSAIRPAANAESKLPGLVRALEAWNAVRVRIPIDVRDASSRAALGWIAALHEGTLRGHRMASDFNVRDSARFSIPAAERPAAKQRLTSLPNRSTAAER
jgi:N-acetyltransferase